jgi:hypothetical protein
MLVKPFLKLTRTELRFGWVLLGVVALYILPLLLLIILLSLAVAEEVMVIHLAVALMAMEAVEALADYEAQ